MKYLHLVAVLFVLGFSVPQPAISGGYEWVAPGEYSFGSCGRVSGRRVPLVLNANAKYHSQFSCLNAYTHGDVCYDHARQIEFNLKRYNTLSQCSNWLNNQLNRCRSFVNNASRMCYQLKK